MSLFAILMALATLLTGLSYWGFALYDPWWKLLFIPLFLLGYFVVLFALSAISWYFMSLPVDLNKEVKKPSKLYYWLLREVCAMGYFFFGVRIKATGLDTIPKDRKYLLVSNHQSANDHLIIDILLRKEMIVSISKPSLEHMFVAGKFMHAAGFIPIDRDNAMNAIKSILQAISFIKNGYCSVSVSPEGTRSKGTEMLPFHAGSFKIATKSNCPIVLAAVTNAPAIKGRCFRKKTIVYVDFLRRIEPEEYQDMSTNEISDLAHHVIEEGTMPRPGRVYYQ